MNYLKLKGDNNFLCLCCLAVVGYLIYLVLYNRPILEGAHCGTKHKGEVVESMVNRKGQKLRKMMMEDARHDVKEIFAAFPGCFNEKPKGGSQRNRGNRGTNKKRGFFDKYKFDNEDQDEDEKKESFFDRMGDEYDDFKKKLKKKK